MLPPSLASEELSAALLETEVPVDGAVAEVAADRWPEGAGTAVGPAAVDAVALTEAGAGAGPGLGRLADSRLTGGGGCACFAEAPVTSRRAD